MELLTNIIMLILLVTILVFPICVGLYMVYLAYTKRDPSDIPSIVVKFSIFCCAFLLIGVKMSPTIKNVFFTVEFIMIVEMIRQLVQYKRGKTCT